MMTPDRKRPTFWGWVRGMLDEPITIIAALVVVVVILVHTQSDWDWIEIFTNGSFVAIWVIALTASAFLLLYRPWAPWKHSEVGQHLQLMTLGLALLAGLTLIFRVFPVGPFTASWVNFVVLTILGLATLHRLIMYVRFLIAERRSKRRPRDGNQASMNEYESKGTAAPRDDDGLVHD